MSQCTDKLLSLHTVDSIGGDLGATYLGIVAKDNWDAQGPWPDPGFHSSSRCRKHSAGIRPVMLGPSPRHRNLEAIWIATYSLSLARIVTMQCVSVRPSNREDRHNANLLFFTPHTSTVPTWRSSSAPTELRHPVSLQPGCRRFAREPTFCDTGTAPARDMR